MPAVYCCAEGLVIDLIKETPPEQMRAFVKKWELEPEQDGKLPGDVGEQIERENPLSIRFTALAEVNGRTLMSSGGCAVSWNSLFPDINGEESQEVVGHYALDPASCWTSGASASNGKRGRAKYGRSSCCSEPTGSRCPALFSL